MQHSELLFLWTIMHGISLDTGTHLARQFAQSGKAKTGDIVIVGLITPIAHDFQLVLLGLKQAAGSICINMEACIAMKMIMKERDTYYLLLKGDAPPHLLLVPEWTIM